MKITILTPVFLLLNLIFVFGQSEHGFIEGENYRDGVIYKTVNGTNLVMDMFYPDEEKMTDENPWVVFIHGGGWSGGHRDNIYKSAFIGGMKQLVDAGVVVATVQYRLAKLSSPDTSYDSTTDCKDAARFLLKNKEEYKLDDENYGIWGGSAGGHLSLVTSLVPDAKFPGDVGLSTITPNYKGVVAYYPFTSCLHEPLRPNSIFEDGTLFERLLGGPLDENLELAADLTPTSFLDENSLPVLLIHGEQDDTLPVINSIYLKEVAIENNADVEFIAVKNADHSFAGNNISPSLENINVSMANFFLEKFGIETIAVDGEEEQDTEIGDVFVGENNLLYTITSLLPNEVEVYGFDDPVTNAVSELVIPATVTDTNTSKSYSVIAIGQAAFSGSSNSARSNPGSSGNHVITSVNLPTSVKHLKIHSFRDLPNLTTINLDNVITTDDSILATMPLLTDIGSLKSMETLGNFAIFACPLLTSVNVGASLTKIGSNFLRGSTNMTDIYFNWTAEELSTIDFNNANYLRDVVPSNITLHVPVGTTTAYTNSPFYITGMTISDDIVLSTDVIAKELGFNVYPNPVKDIVTLENSQLKNTKVTLIDMSGRVLLSIKANNSLNQINLSNLSSGVYLMKVITDSYTFEERIIKQ